MIRLSAFADEISPNLDEQVSVLLSEGIAHVELRGMWDTNVLDLSDAQLSTIKAVFEQNSIAVSAIGSPIGKVPIDESFDAHVHRFERAVTCARYFGSAYIRIFSFYPPGGPSAGADMTPFRDQVLYRLRELTSRAAAADVTLLHENEKDIYGDTIVRCVDLLSTINDPHFAAILDPANFIQCDQVPYPDAFEAIRPWLRYVHVKDALPDGTVVAAGEGATHWPELLKALYAGGYDGFLSLEPHLTATGRLGGYSGAERFRHASQSLQRLLRDMEWAHA